MTPSPRELMKRQPDSGGVQAPRGMPEAADLGPNLEQGLKDTLSTRLTLGCEPGGWDKDCLVPWLHLPVSS